MRSIHTVLLSIAVCCASLACLPCIAQAIENPGEELQEVGVNPVLGQTVDGSIFLADADGKRFTVSEILAGTTPVILVPVYYSCPRMCGLILSGLVKLLNEMDLKLGKDFRVVAVSFDPEEGPPLARKRLDEYQAQLVKAPEPGGMQFFVGLEDQVRRLMDQVGFRYKKDGDEYAHSAAIIVLTPQGKISQYFTGIEFSPWDVRLSLIDASQGAIGSTMDHVLLFCFRFDPTKGKYTLAALNVMKLGGVLTLAALGAVIFFSTRKT